MKKLLLVLGTLATVVTPVATVVACGSNEGDTTTDKIDETIKTLQSTKTEIEISAVDLTTLENKEVSYLESALGITTEVIKNVLVSEGVKFENDKLTFKAGQLGEEKTYTFTITPKAATDKINIKEDNVLKALKKNRY